ncbi:glycoside hydrolase family 3 N-terminal domain-containing protein [Actinoplanes sp. NPDC049265]|uniref:glycoside hydrolase family 3 N-terminal domain-containing protein n=1 Tax=Actinoplanes sp. NPDC049265 TaxID=3363902 RepID=UPI0037109C6A
MSDLPSSSPSSPQPSSCRLSLEQKAGQLLMIGTDVDSPRGLADEIKRYQLGGIFLAGRSTRPAAALKADIQALQGNATTPLLVALDQEGGSVQTLKGGDFPLIPSAERLGNGPPDKLRDEVRDSARRLAGIGVTINLAPVADTVPADIGEANPPIGNFHRQYGSDPAEVAKDIEVAVTASQDSGVLTVLKHFPGLGRTRFNTDTSAQAVDATATANDPYLQPFAAGIKAGSASVMMSSASYPKLDGKDIAAFSKPIITGLLRQKMGFDGLVVSDDLGAAKAAATISPGERAVRFVAAGGDLALSIRPEDAQPMAEALITRARTDPAFATRVDDAAGHVLRAKIRARQISC